MSKSRKKQSKSSIPLIALVIGGLVLVAAAVFFAVRGKGEDTGTPKIVVDQQVIDFGDVKLNTPVNFSVKVTNQGDGVLRFEDKPFIQVAEGC